MDAGGGASATGGGAADVVDPRGSERSHAGVLARALADPATRVLRWHDGLVPLRAGGPGLDLVAPADAPDRGVVVLLGRDGGGAAHLAAEVPAAGPGWQDLRRAGPDLPAGGAELLTRATAVLRWHAGHPRCPRCGGTTTVEQAGWVRRCTEDGSEHFPRTDPAVIMTVLDADDRLLLGHGAAWPEGRFSTLAGFVEPGESLEDAVRREVLEEVGVAVGEVTYVASQAWPFPASLMLGFTARALGTAVTTDDVEVTDARWFTRAELAAAVGAGSVRLPGGRSISHRLIRDWYGSDLPGASWG